MNALIATQDVFNRNLSIQLFKWCETVKLIRYVKPSKRVTEKQQIAATERDGIAITVIEGKDGRTIDNAIKILKAGNGLLIHSLYVLSRSRKRIEEICRRVFDKGAAIVDASGVVYHPENAVQLIAAVNLGGHIPKNSGQHGGHNKIDLETRMKAFVWWQRHDFTNAQVEEFAGIPYATMRGWWQGEHPRPVTRGRPKGSTDSKPRRTR